MDLTGRRETDPGVGLSPLTDPPSRISTPSSPGDAANSSFVTSAILAYSCRQAATARLAPLSTPGDGSQCSMEGVTVKLEEADLWRNFHSCGTEMIINRAGRRMFPCVNISIEGLEPRAVYRILLDIVPGDTRRFKFLNGRWVAVGRADPEVNHSPYVHPDSGNTGNEWMNGKISFAKMKITNSKDQRDGNMTLHSMHKYLACIHVIRQDPSGSDSQHLLLPLKLTSFIAVTAYQNEHITQMKIRNNPFAKAFRDADTVAFLRSKSPENGRCYINETTPNLFSQSLPSALPMGLSPFDIHRPITGEMLCPPTTSDVMRSGMMCSVGRSAMRDVTAGDRAAQHLQFHLGMPWLPLPGAQHLPFNYYLSPWLRHMAGLGLGESPSPAVRYHSPMMSLPMKRPATSSPDADSTSKKYKLHA